MPIYEYECKNCNNRFEKLQPVTADPIKVCPNCGEESVRRVLHPVGIIFKGSGWYVTDTRKAPPSETSSEGSSSSGKSSEGKSSESKDSSSGKGESGKESASTQ